MPQIKTDKNWRARHPIVSLHPMGLLPSLNKEIVDLFVILKYCHPLFSVFVSGIYQPENHYSYLKASCTYKIPLLQ